MSDKPTGYADQILAKRSASASPAPAAATPDAGAAPAATPDAVSNVTHLSPKPAAVDNGNGVAAALLSRRRRPPRLNLITKDGVEESFPYIQLMPIRLDGNCITLRYPWVTFQLKGRNMQKLKRRLDAEVQGTILEVDQLVDAADGESKPYAVYEIKEIKPGESKAPEKKQK